MLSGTKWDERTPIDGISIDVGSDASRKSPKPLGSLAPGSALGLVPAEVLEDGPADGVPP
jgi:hypothetical protein